MRAFVTVVVVVGSCFASCVPPAPAVETPSSCLLDDDCGGRTPFCVAGGCVECVRDRDCDDGETCDDGLCLEDDEGEEGEGEGEGEGAGEGEGEEGEGEGEGDDGSVSCDIDAVCDGGEACVSVVGQQLRYCFERCAAVGDDCQNLWGQDGACTLVDGQNVCVAVGGALSVCSSFGNSVCDDGFKCVELALAIHQCVPDCSTQDECIDAGFDGCFDFLSDGNGCYGFVDEGERCGFIDDGTWRFCDQDGFACDFTGGLPFGLCRPDDDGDGIVDDPSGGGPIDDDGSHVPDGSGGGGEGEGEEEEEEDVPCGVSADCVIASFASNDDCADNADCNGGDVNSANQVCLRDSLGQSWCALRSQNEIRCEQMPNNPRLTTTPGTDTEGDSVGFCAVPAGVFCNVATDVCAGGIFDR